MKKTTISALLLASSLLANEPNPARLTVRQMEKGGIGYNTGYTSLDLFFAPIRWEQSLSFVNLRAHRLDNNTYAGNAGLGWRIASPCCNWIWGVNGFYDFRNSKHHRWYNQVGVGAELLGNWISFRANGYFPFGQTKKLYNVNQSSGFGTPFFSGHFLILPNSKTQEFAMRGANFEADVSLVDTENWQLNFALGPYYFTGSHEHTWGGKARLSATVYKYLSLDLSDSYDHIFHNKVQGQIGLNFWFGPNCNNRCASRCNDRLMQPVTREEIVVLDKKRIGTQQIAINPLTNEPLFFVFVNNTNGSDGTFEDPYAKLLDAQNNSSPFDIIYVYEGDGTTKGMDEGIVLKDYQRLLSSGITNFFDTTKGRFRLPAQTAGMPHITNGVGNTTVTLANHTEASGFRIENRPNVLAAIAGTSITDGVILSNIIDGPSLANGEGIGIALGSGHFLIEGNQVIGSTALTGARVGIGVQSDTLLNSIVRNNIVSHVQVGIISATNLSASHDSTHFTLIEQNTVTDSQGTSVFLPQFGISAISIGLTNTAHTISTIQNNTTTNCVTGIGVVTLFDGEHESIVRNNIMTNNTQAAFSEHVGSATGASAFVTLENNTMIGNSTHGATIEAQGNVSLSFHALGNTLESNDFTASTLSSDASMCLRLNNNTNDLQYNLNSFAGSTYNLEPPTGNTGTIVETGTINTVAPGTCP